MYSNDCVYIEAKDFYYTVYIYSIHIFFDDFLRQNKLYKLQTKQVIMNSFLLVNIHPFFTK